MGRGVSVKKEEYDYIKSLLFQGMKAEQIAKKLGRSPDTIRTVDYSYDYEDFIKTPTKELRQRRKMNKQEQMQIKVSDLCELEKSEIEEQAECSGSREKDIPGIRVSELSVQDKKELAMYAIDQHYFFLKQLTGVI